MNISGKARILKDDRGIYKTTLVSTDTNKETGEEEKIFMKINVGFKKGVEVKNKTKINITNGFITFFRIDTGEIDEDGNLKRPIYKYFPKLVIMDFEVIEDGIDEVYSSKPKKAVENNPSDNGMYQDLYDSSNVGFDELPF